MVLGMNSPCGVFLTSGKRTQHQVGASSRLRLSRGRASG
jgi:hypothetical protein